MPTVELCSWMWLQARHLDKQRDSLERIIATPWDPPDFNTVGRWGFTRAEVRGKASLSSSGLGGGTRAAIAPDVAVDILEKSRRAGRNHMSRIAPWGRLLTRV